MSGIIQELNCDYNTQVKKGQQSDIVGSCCGQRMSTSSPPQSQEQPRMPAPNQPRPFWDCAQTATARLIKDGAGLEIASPIGFGTVRSFMSIALRHQRSIFRTSIVSKYLKIAGGVD